MAADCSPPTGQTWHIESTSKRQRTFFSLKAKTLTRKTTEEIYATGAYIRSWHTFKMKYLLTISFSIFSILLSGQSSEVFETRFEYYDDGSVKTEYKEFNGQKVDTLKAYDKIGRLKAILYFGKYGSTEPIYREDYLYTGASRKITGYHIMEPGKAPIDVGVQKAYWKNGRLMDSVIYDMNGQRIYRARFGKNGKLLFEHR